MNTLTKSVLFLGVLFSFGNLLAQDCTDAGLQLIHPVAGSGKGGVQQCAQVSGTTATCIPGDYVKIMNNKWSCNIATNILNCISGVENQNTCSVTCSGKKWMPVTGNGDYGCFGNK